MNKLNLGQNVGLQMTRNRDLLHKIHFQCKYEIKHFDKFGKKIGDYLAFNDIVNEGKNTLFNVMFNSGTQILSTAWAIGLISNVSYSALAATDVMASHSGWTEFVSYNQTTRVAWGPGTSTSQVVTNATPAQFDINAPGTVKGVFLSSDNTKNGNTGKLWGTALFTNGDVPVNSGDQLKITFSISA